MCCCRCFRKLYALEFSHLALLNHDAGFCRVDDNTADIDILLEHDVAVLIKGDDHGLCFGIVFPFQEFQPVSEGREQLGTIFIGNRHQRCLKLALTVFIRLYIFQGRTQCNRRNERSGLNLFQHFCFGLFVLILLEIRHCGNQIGVFDCGFFQL